MKATDSTDVEVCSSISSASINGRIQVCCQHPYFSKLSARANQVCLHFLSEPYDLLDLWQCYIEVGCGVEAKSLISGDDGLAEKVSGVSKLQIV
jgi:hypothetical protein